MYDIAIVLARCGSKGIPYKNIYPICGKPMISYCLKALSQSKINEYFVSTDCEKIKKVAEKYGAKTIKRPKKLSKDNTSSKESLLHAISQIKNIPDKVLLIQATSPLITPQDINKALKLLDEYDSIISVVESHSFLWSKSKNTIKPIDHNYLYRKPRQLSNPKLKETGSIYGTKYKNLIDTKKLLSGNIGYIKIPKIRSFEIDDYEDVFIIESIIKNYHE